MKTGRKHLGRNFTIFLAVVAVSRYASRLIMVGQIQTVPCVARKSGLPLGQSCFPFRKRHFLGIPLTVTVVRIFSGTCMLKLKYHVELASIRVCVLLRFL